MQEATRDVGASLVICTVTTAIGFLVFVPTAYKGVAELGLIAGGGMVIIVFLTFTLLPALLTSWLRFDPERHIRSELRFEEGLGQWVEAHASSVRWIAAGLAVGALYLAQWARFDPNVIEMRDPRTESVQTFNELLAASGASSPWYLDATAATLDEARGLARRVAEIPQVDYALTLADYVPADQDEKLSILEDTAFLLDVPPSAPRGVDATVDEMVDALRDLHDFLGAEWVSEERSVLGASMRELRAQLARFLERIGSDENPREALAKLEEILLASLPGQVQRLRAALTPDEITLADLPPELTARMITPEGIARVQIFPRDDLRIEENIRAFSAPVKAVAPKATGIALNLIAFEEATKQSFVQALVSALALIAALLWILWRNFQDLMLVVAPLLLSSILSVAAMVLMDLPFNFVNVVAIPLMFGIGVDSGIHLVHRSHTIDRARESLLGTTTARAVYYSAVTTFVSFGSLAFSAHKGMASLGSLLAVGMALTVFCNLVVLPALIEGVRSKAPES